MALKTVLTLKPKQLPPLIPKKSTIKMTHKYKISRRILISTTSMLLAGITTSCTRTAEAFEFDFRMTVPDQTIEAAMSGIRYHAQSFLQVKEMFENSDKDSWKEVQRELRKRSSYLKQDMYTIIQGKPGEERPQLRKLYSTLFNNVTRLDYAARDKDEATVRLCLDNIFVALDHFLSTI